MADTKSLNDSSEELPLTPTGEPTDQLDPEENDFQDDEDFEKDTEDDVDFDEEPLDDDEEDLDDEEVKRLFPGQDDFAEEEEDDEDEEPYEGIRHGDQEDEGLVDDNMSSMPVIQSPS